MYRINNQKLPGSIGVTMTNVDAETHIAISKEYKVILCFTIINRQINTYKYRKRKVTTYNYVRKTNQSNICIFI